MRKQFVPDLSVMHQLTEEPRRCETVNAGEWSPLKVVTRLSRDDERNGGRRGGGVSPFNFLPIIDNLFRSLPEHGHTYDVGR